MRFTHKNAYSKPLWCILIIFMFISIPLIYAQEPIYRQNTKIALNIPCTNNGTYCSTSATCNATIIAPSGNVLVNNQIMTKTGVVFNWTLNEASTTQAGDYEFNIQCTDGGWTKAKTLSFSVTPNGSAFNIGNALSMIGLIAVLVFIIVLCLFWFNGTEQLWGKALAFGGLWFLFIVLEYSLYIVGTNYLYTVSFLGIFFKWSFITHLILTFPMMLGMVGYYGYVMITNKYMMNMLKHGVPEDRAMMREMRRGRKK